MTVISAALADPHQLSRSADPLAPDRDRVLARDAAAVRADAQTICVLASQIAITALFALSLDLILGYAGIVSLGHAAFFGFGAYTAGLHSKWGWGEPLTGLVIAAIAAGLLGYLMSFIIARFRHLALIMITLGLGSAAARPPTARAGSPAAPTACRACTCGRCSASSVRSLRLHRLQLRADRAVPVLSGRPAADPIRRSACRCAASARTRSACARSAPRAAAHIRKIYTIAAVMAGVAGALLTQTTETVSLEALSFQRSADVLVILILGGTGRLYGGIDRRDHLHGRARPVLRHQSAILVFLDRRAADRGRAVSAERHSRRASARLTAIKAELGVSAPALSTRGLDKSFGSLVVARDIETRAAARRALRADRAERRRQDHADQPDDRHAAAGRRPDLPRRGRDHRARPGGARAPRARAHLPDQHAVSASERARSGDARGLRAARLRRDLVAAHCRPIATRSTRPMRFSSRCCSVRTATARPASSPTASSGCSRSRWRSPPGRRCCCSTSRPPACRATKAPSCSPPSQTCRRTSRCCSSSTT